MKNLKTICFLFLTLAVISCSKKDDDGGGSAPEAEFSATIKGGTFGDNYTSKLGSYYTDSSVGLTIAITDANNNVIRFFLNETGGLGSGTDKIIGDIDNNGYYTSVVIWDQGEEIAYNSSEGNIKVLDNKANPEDEDGRLISGNFSISAISNTSVTMSMTGTFKNIAY